MKRTILLLATVVALSSCAMQDYPPQKYFYGADFRPYLEEGFIVSPKSAGFRFTILAMLNVETTNGIKTRHEESKTKTWKTKYDNPTTGQWRTFVSLTEVLESMVDKAKKMGANGILDFKISRYPSIDSDTGWLIKGLAVVIDNAADAK